MLPKRENQFLYVCHNTSGSGWCGEKTKIILEDCSCFYKQDRQSGFGRRSTPNQSVVSITLKEVGWPLLVTGYTQTYPKLWPMAISLSSPKKGCGSQPVVGNQDIPQHRSKYHKHIKWESTAECMQEESTLPMSCPQGPLTMEINGYIYQEDKVCTTWLYYIVLLYMYMYLYARCHACMYSQIRQSARLGLNHSQTHVVCILHLY